MTTLSPPHSLPTPEEAAFARESARTLSACLHTQAETQQIEMFDHTLLDLRGSRDAAQGEMMRFIAEAAWYPTALLRSQGVRWDAVDDHSARATFSGGKSTLTMLFTFADDDPARSARAEARSRTIGDRVVPIPWEGRCSNYQRRDGMKRPIEGEVAWLLAEGRKPYWQGRISRLRYTFAP